MVPYFVSFYPQVPMEENLSVFQPLDVPEVQKLLTEAAGVVIPRYILPSRYETIVKLTRHWFPRLRAKHVYEGKIRQIRLFRELNIRHPESLLFEGSAELLSYFNVGGVPWEYPLVLNGDTSPEHAQFSGQAPRTKTVSQDSRGLPFGCIRLPH